MAVEAAGWMASPARKLQGKQVALQLPTAPLAYPLRVQAAARRIVKGAALPGRPKTMRCRVQTTIPPLAPSQVWVVAEVVVVVVVVVGWVEAQAQEGQQATTAPTRLRFDGTDPLPLQASVWITTLLPPPPHLQDVHLLRQASSA